MVPAAHAAMTRKPSPIEYPAEKLAGTAPNMVVFHAVYIVAALAMPLMSYEPPPPPPF